MAERLKRFYGFLVRYYIIDVALIVIAMAFILNLRLLYADSTRFMPQYFFNGERILTTNDGYHYANATRDWLDGYSGDEAFFPAAEFQMPALLSVMIYKMLPISLDDLFFYMPMVLSVLLVIPVFLITKNVSNTLVAFLAAILAPITQSYAIRTMGGYYDTDMLILTLPLMSVYFLLRMLEYCRIRDCILGVIFCILAMAWHSASGIYLVGAAVFLAICYALIFLRKNPKIFELLGVLIIALSTLNIFLKIALIAVFLHFIADRVYILKTQTNAIKARLKYKSAVLFLLALGIGLLANADLFIKKFIMYVVAADVLQNSGIIVRGVTDTILELKPLYFGGAVVRIIGDYVSFIIASLGILLLIYKKPQTIILLPFVLLGLASVKIGIRFSMFASPVFSIGVFYFVYFLTQFVHKIFDDKVVIYGVKVAVYVAISWSVIMPHIYFSKNIGYAPSLYGDELSALNAIKDDSKSRDSVTISWWDYGFLTSYYSNTRSIISGIDMDGVMHFVAARIITETNQKAAYNLMKIATNLYYNAPKDLQGNLVEKIVAKYGDTENPNAVFANMEHLNDAPLERDIYIFIPYQLFELTATIEQFSDIDLRNGKATFANAKLVQYYNIAKEGDIFVLDDIMKFDEKNGTITDIESGKTLRLQAFHSVNRIHNTLQTTITKYSDDKDALIAVFSSDMNRFFLIDERTNNSLLVQFFLYENYDRNLYRMIYKNAQSKAWKLK